MSNFVPKKEYLREILLHYFFQKKSAAEAHRILVETYGDHALSETTCRDWFRRFKNNDFDIEDKERSGAPKKFEDEELEALLDEDPCQTQKELTESLGVDHTTVAKVSIHFHEKTARTCSSPQYVTDEAKYNIDELVDDLKRAVRLEFSQEECLNVVLDSVVNVSKTSIEGTTEVVIDKIFLTLLGHKSKQIVAKTAKAIAEIAKTDRGRKKCTTIELIRALIDLLGCVQIPHPMVKTLENCTVRKIYAEVFGWLGSTQVGNLNAPLKEEDIDILTQACRALGNICHKNENGKNLVREQDGLKVILTVLKEGIALRNVEGANALWIEATQFLSNFLEGQKALCMKALEEDMLPILCEILELHLLGIMFKDESNNVAAENVYITLNILTIENIIFLNERLAIVLICIMRYRQPSYHDLSFDELTMKCLHIIHGQAKDEKVKLLLVEARAVEWLLHLWEKFGPQYNDEGMQSKLICIEYLLIVIASTDDCLRSLKPLVYAQLMEWLKLRVRVHLPVKKIGREHCAVTVGTKVIIYKVEMTTDGRPNVVRVTEIPGNTSKFTHN